VGRRLRAFREAAGKTRGDVVTARICSRSKLEKLEFGQNPIRPGDVRELCLFYGVDPQTTNTLATLAHGSTDPGWWEEYGAVIRPDFTLYLGLEADARTICAFEPDLVHGLVQTEEYARAIERVTPDPITARDVERNVALRMQRQRAVFGSRRPPQLEIVLGEAALLKEWGPPRARVLQLAHLRGLARRGHVAVRVLPLAAGLTPTPLGGFSVLDFDDPADPAVAYHETYDGAHYPEEPATVARYRRRFAMTREKSVPIEEYAS
jgi:transcriptional regulator with XRE-family HTH domain